MNVPLVFFTAEDPREIPRGSRDPLRFLPVWAAIGRRMVPYLTTVTPSYRGFLTRFLFHGGLEELVPALADAPREAQWEAFCRFEQLCAIVRSSDELSVQTRNFPGISGISTRIKKAKFSVGSETSYWLVMSQKNTGFWGYYHQASMGSGILKNNNSVPSGYQLSDASKRIFDESPARVLINKYAGTLRAVFTKKVVELSISEFDELAQLFAEKPYFQGTWGEFWYQQILIADSEIGTGYSREIKESFAEAIAAVYRPGLSQGEIWERLTESNIDAVRDHAINVQANEAVIGLCEWVFDVCRLRHEQGETLDKAGEWAKDHGFNSDWLSRLANLSEPPDEQLREYRELALSGENTFQPLAIELLKRHKVVMSSRKSAPWVEVLDSGQLNVREPVAEILPKDFKKHFQRYPSGVRWRYDYFMNAWTSAASEIGFLPEAENG